MIEVLELEDQDREAWDDYVTHSADATVFHLAGWRDVMRTSFGLRSHFLLARADGEIRGVLPLLHVRSRLAGHFLTSMPGALCAGDDETAGALVQRAEELVHSHGADYLILRDSHTRWDLPGLTTDESQCTLVVPLDGDSKEAWGNVNRHARRQTNKAKKAGLRVIRGFGALDDFYPAFSRAMRDLGTPTLGRRFFAVSAALFPRNLQLLTVSHQDDIYGGGIIAPFRDTVYCTWSGMLREHYDLYPNHLLFWEVLQYGIENGYHQVDLGRSEWDSGSFHFKRHWGAEAQPLYQQTYLNGRGRPPRVGNSLEEDAKYRYFVQIWRRLPLAVTEFIGPLLRRRMPFG